MKLHKRVRLAAKLSKNKMWKVLKRKSKQSYDHHENCGMSISAKELVMLRKLYPGTLEDFWELIEKESRAA